ncbi:MAG: hypothetical protein VX641_02630 [Planctomycetota bacterium]|nr:hypothetical protein [Planctomycetota bacterium]
MFLVSLIVGVLCTIFIWPLVRSGLARVRQRHEEMMRGADPSTRAAVEFYQPPRWMRSGGVASVLHFILVLIPVTILVYLLFSQL